jgi:aspartate/methionine/tyrosine aminotransferase
MNTSLIAQDMALNAMKTPRSYIDAQLKIWKGRRDMIYEGLRDLGLDLWKPEGAFYVLPKVDNPKKVLWTLYSKYKTITYLGEWFGAPDRIRLSYALDAKLIEEGLKRIGKCLEEVK